MGTVSFDFKGEVALITGGSRGLGLEIAQAFGAAGATVVITARREQWLKEAEQVLKDQGVPVHAFIADVADPASVEMPLERWRQVIDANITGTFLMSQVAGRHMLERGKGVMVNVASIAGLSGGQHNTVGYNASKAAVINLTRALSVEWSGRGIRVNAIAPGLFRTRMSEVLVQLAEAANVQVAPMGRIGRPGEIGPTVLFLASEGASYITGQVIPIDGGRSAQ